MTEIEVQRPQNLHELLKAQNTQDAFRKVLGSRSEQYIASIITMVNNNQLLRKCEPISLVNACIISATLDLSIDPNLGFAYIVPYKDRAQFQIGWKGLVQLAIRTGEYKRLGANIVYEGQLQELDDFTGEPIFNFNNKTSDTIIGYMAYFELVNGFRKSAFMTKNEADFHGKKYSQTYKKGYGVWKDNFDSMAKKTVLKLLLGKFAPLSTQMQKAIIDDQMVEGEYVDNTITFEVENASIEGESIEEQPVLQKVIEKKASQSQLKKAFAMLNSLDEETQKIVEEGRVLMFGEKSRKEYTVGEVSKWIEYLQEFQEDTE